MSRTNQILLVLKTPPPYGGGEVRSVFPLIMQLVLSNVTIGVVLRESFLLAASNQRSESTSLCARKNGYCDG